MSDVVLHYAHPLHVKYEMFLDKGGKKISKSTGNVLTPQVWLRYGTLNLFYYFYSKELLEPDKLAQMIFLL